MHVNFSTKNIEGQSILIGEVEFAILLSCAELAWNSAADAKESNRCMKLHNKIEEKYLEFKAEYLTPSELKSAAVVELDLTDDDKERITRGWAKTVDKRPSGWLKYGSQILEQL